METVVRLTPFHDSFVDQYCFTQFQIGMNFLSFDMLAQLPPTDCRLRPDIRAYEYGDLQLATLEKARIEEK